MANEKDKLVRFNAVYEDLKKRLAAAEAAVMAADSDNRFREPVTEVVWRESVAKNLDAMAAFIQFTAYAGALSQLETLRTIRGLQEDTEKHALDKAELERKLAELEKVSLALVLKILPKSIT